MNRHETTESSAVRPEQEAALAFAPASGLPGRLVTLTGAHFDDATAVKFFDGARALYRVASPATIEAVVPAGARSGRIRVMTPHGTLRSADSFVVPELRSDEIGIRTLPYKHLPYTSGKTNPLDDATPRDVHGVAIHTRDGERNYHPVILAQETLRMLDGYRISGDGRYLDRARLHGYKLLELAVEHEGALFFPYMFDFPLGQLRGRVMRAPWYSAMAQGQALSAFVRLCRVTEDSAYLRGAHRTFQSFTMLRDAQDAAAPWIAYVDEAGYLWLEEYPQREEPVNMLNGFNYSIFGLYDYHQLAAGIESGALLVAALTTVAHHTDEYRNPGYLSAYYRGRGSTSVKYHRRHVIQLKQLYLMTRDQRFLDASEAFARDYAIS